MTALSLRERLASRASELGCTLPPADIGALCAYFELLKVWNRRLSLTALPVEDNGIEAIDRLLLEPALAIRHIPSSARTLIDIGSGGGSPALPLKILRPELSLMMVESREKKGAFLREVIRQLGIRGASVETARYEDLLESAAVAARTDIVSLRAVKTDASALAQLGRLLWPSGLLLLFLAQESAAEPQGLKRIAFHTLLPDRGTSLEIFQRV